MSNNFTVSTCRFHTKEKDRLLIVGYFDNDDIDKNHNPGYSFYGRMLAFFLVFFKLKLTAFYKVAYALTGNSLVFGDFAE